MRKPGVIFSHFLALYLHRWTWLSFFKFQRKKQTWCYNKNLNFLPYKVKVKVAQLCPTLCDPTDWLYSPWNSPGQKWVAVPFSRGSSQPRDWTQVSCIAGRFFTSWATREVLFLTVQVQIMEKIGEIYVCICVYLCVCICVCSWSKSLCIEVTRCDFSLSNI